MSQTRSPRCQIVINGENAVPMECNVHLSIHQSADTFYAKLPFLPKIGLDAAFWANTSSIPVDIQARNGGTGSYTSLLTGIVDQPQLIFAEQSVQIRGRDKTASLTETKTNDLFRNLTDKQIIQQLAQGAGLTVQFNGAAASAGLQYDQDYSELADSDTAWNMIVALARKAGCIAFVKGTTVYVQPIDATPPNGNFTLNYTPPQNGAPAKSDAIILFCRRNLQLAKETQVTVQSWQHKQGKTITSKFSSKPKNAGSDRLIYAHRSANLTKSQQDKMASAHLKETLSHEREVDAENLPGDTSVIPGLKGFVLRGTQTDFDQTYILSDAVHRFGLEANGGYAMDLTSHSQDASRGEPTQEQ